MSLINFALPSDIGWNKVEFPQTVRDNEASATTEGHDPYNELRQRSPRPDGAGGSRRRDPWAGLYESGSHALSKGPPLTFVVSHRRSHGLGLTHIGFPPITSAFSQSCPRLPTCELVMG